MSAFAVDDAVTFLHEDRWLVGTVTAVDGDELEVLIAVQATVPALAWKVQARDAFRLVPERETGPQDETPEPAPQVYTPDALRIAAAELRVRARAASLRVLQHDLVSKRDPDPRVRKMAAAQKSVARCQVQRAAQWAGVLEMNADAVEEKP